MVTVRYEGPTAKHEVIGLATGRHYGRKQHGDIFQANEADVSSYPEMFTVLARPTVQEPALPKLPTDIRQPDAILRPSARPIVEVEPDEFAPTLDEPQATKSEGSFVMDKPARKGRGRPRKG